MALALEPAPGPLLAPALDALRVHSELSVPPPGNLHVTLAFLGEVDAGQVQGAAGAVRSVAAEATRWTIGWGSTGAFPYPARPRVLWLGLADEAATAAVRARLVLQLARDGLAVEDRPFRPHLTLARVRSAVTAEVAAALVAHLAAIPAPPPAEVRGLVLYASRGGRSGPVYEALASVDLPAVDD